MEISSLEVDAGATELRALRMALGRKLEETEH
jgi:hypothetical protein